jgi:cytoskeletal protein CcmA (bactofilin family)
MMFKTKTIPGSITPTSVAPEPALKPPATPTIISAEMTVLGNLNSTGDLQVDGIVTGDIAAHRLVIAESGTVNGNVAAQQVRICGALNGAVRSARLTLTATARVLGDVHHEVLTVETGGQLEGHSHRIVADPAPTALTRTTPSALHEANDFLAT